MKLTLRLLLILLAAACVVAQDRSQSTNSLFEASEVRTLSPGNIMIQGEVQDPGVVDLSQLPLRNVAIKELALENGKHVFKGAFFASGYALYDILNGKKIRKAPENTFAPPVDMYAIVENGKGEKAVFSWGEIYYRNSFNILITKSVQAINPVRIKTSWPLPDSPRLISANDLLNVRFIENPTKITVKSYHGSLVTEKPKDIYSPEIRLVSKKGSAAIGGFGPSIEKRRNDTVLYGHGMGFKEVLTFTGYLLKDLIAANVKVTPDDLRQAIAIVSAKDGYRSVFSMSEIMNRNDNQDLLLQDLKDSRSEGRYTLIPSDYFADRDVRAVEKIELIDID